MNELDEYMGNVYQKTNAELIDIIKRQQEEQRMVGKKNCMFLTIICLILSVSVMFISFIGYLNNKNWLETWNSYDYEIVSLDSENGNANYIGNNGDITNGESESENRKTEK